jgi:hypothetical protein
MEAELIGTLHGDQGGAGDQAAVAFALLGAPPDVTEKNFLGEIDQFGYSGANSFGGRWFVLGHVISRLD